ncbi:MAG: Rrf2 family transcriptional regulator [Kiritimatiellae bacterium]|nr:Rrf2 family transcriptional regulator [Kiritimatiellia bacterium]MDW8458346.1 Rrf2 family transcriptional regulator [Verrucomicrobiota bacterium]
MLSLTKRVEYAVMAILHMAEAKPSEWCSSKGIAERYQIPAELLGKVLQALARASIVQSTPGVRGGYRLARPLESLNLGMVIEAVEGPIRLTDCQANPSDCDQLCYCTIREPMQAMQSRLQQFIYSIPLEQFRGFSSQGMVR